MAVFKKGTFVVSLGFVKLGGELTDEDRQCAWRLYTELVTRVSVYGKVAEGEEDFSGEVYVESLDSMYAFFGNAREIMADFPVGRVADDNQDHLGFFILKILETVIRPFLEKWQASYRRWYSAQVSAGSGVDTFAVQEAFPQIAEFKSDWTLVRRFCREVAGELADTYKLTDIRKVMSADLRAAWSQSDE